MVNISKTSSDEVTFRHWFDVDIYYEDTDLSGFVYHANYLKFFERAREHLIGIERLSDLFKQGVHFVVSRADLSYLRPVCHGDRLKILTTGRFSRSPAAEYEQIAYTSIDGRPHQEAVKGKITLVALNHKNRPIRMPDSLIEYFRQKNLK